MNAKKLSALALAIVMALSAMTVVMFAADDDCTTCNGTGTTGSGAAECTDCFGTGKIKYLDDTTSSAAIEQKYTATVTEEKTDVTKVQVSWTLETIEANITTNKIWDTESLTWVADTTKSDTCEADDVTATFNIVNLSSVKVGAQVTFSAVSGFDPEIAFNVDGTEATKGTATLDTKATSSGADNDTEIKVTLTPGEDDFKSVTESTTEEKTYGTYTVKIGKASAELVTLTFTNSNAQATISYNGTNYAYNETFSFTVPKGSTVSIASASFTQSSLTVDGKTVTQTSTNGYMALWTISDGVVITQDTSINSANCILSGTPVLLADGSTKRIDDVTTDDRLMTFNFYEGKLDGNYPMYVMKHENVISNVITLTFDNGTVLEMCDWQQLFDMDAKTYFDIDAFNYRESVGKNVLFTDGTTVSSARITEATMEVRTCTSFEIFTEYNKNFTANGILTVEPETYLQGVYTIGDDLTIDREQYDRDVSVYGRYSYAEFADIMTEHEFDVLNIADKKIAVGKGTVSEEWLFDLYREWTPLYR